MKLNQNNNLQERAEGEVKRSTAMLGFFLMILCVFFTKSYATIEKKIVISVSMNEKFIKMHPQPMMQEHRVYVTLRTVCELFQLQLDWFEETGEIHLSQQDKVLVFFANEEKRDVLRIQDLEEIMDAPVLIKDGRTMIPVRFLAEKLGCEVTWDSQTFTVHINKPDAIIPIEAVLERSYTDEDFMWLSRIVEVETGSNFDNKLAVANVVLNRKNHANYPNTIQEVILDTRWSVQFPPAHKENFFERNVSDDSRIASKMALEGYNNAENSLFFNSVPFKSTLVTFYKKIGDNFFYF